MRMTRSVAKRPLPRYAASHPDELLEARGQLAAERGTDERVPASVDDRSITDRCEGVDALPVVAGVRWRHPGDHYLGERRRR